MADTRATSGIGQRIKELRKRRGFKSPKELAESIRGGNVTTAVLENVESGRKADLSVSQLLNIARALRVPPIFLLADVTTPASQVDLPNLSDSLSAMSIGEFEAWFSGTPGGEYRTPDPEERLDLQQLVAYRTLTGLHRELIRQNAINSTLDVVSEQSPRTAQLRAEVSELEDYLDKSGWKLPGRS